MNPAKLLLAACTIFLAAVGTYAQAPARSVAEAPAAAATPAYAELLLRQTELDSELESLLVEYTEEFPRIGELRYERGLIEKELVKLREVPAARTNRLTLALGKLMVRRSELATDLWKLLKDYKEEHPDVKRAMRRVEIYDNAIKQLLP